MRGLILGLLVLEFSITGCTNSRHNNNTALSDTLPNLESSSNIADVAENASIYDSLLLPYKTVVDTLNSAGDNLVYSEYFLHDITGDGQPELWVVSGTCEADKELWVYQSSKDSVKKFHAGYGGHTEFFLKGNHLGSLTCNTGDGYVSAYTYKDGKILVESIEYNGWDEDELVKVKTARDRFIADIWETSDTTINLQPLK